MTIEQELLIALRRLANSQDEQNALLTKLTNQLSAAQRQQATMLQRWQSENPALSAACRRAFSTLEKVHKHYLTGLTDEIAENADNIENEFTRNELIDRFGQRVVALNTLLQTLGQLGGVAETAQR